MAQTKYFKEYGLNTREQYFEYLIDSKINGNYTQVKELITNMPKHEKGMFLLWCEQWDYHNDDNVKFCKNAVISQLAGIKTFSVYLP